MDILKELLKIEDESGGNVTGLRNLIESGRLTTASDMARPDPKVEVQQIDAVNAFMRRNPLADGGMLRQEYGRGSGPASIKVRKYLETLPKNSNIVVLDIADELDVDRGVVDNVLKEKKFENKKFKKLRKAGFITNENFAKEYKNYQKSDAFITGEDREFAKYLNDKGLKAETKSGEHTAKSINIRRKRLNIKSASITQPRLTDKDVLKEAKKFKIDTKGLNPEEIRSKVLNKRQAESLLKKRAEDPALDERLRQEAIERAKKRRQRLLSTEEGRAILKEQSRKEKAKRYLKEGLDPPANSAKEMLWKDTVKTAKEDSRFFIKSGYKKSMKKGDYYSDKIKIKDSITGKTFTFNTLENFINKNANSFNISNYDEVIKPYKQKQFINDKGLRNILNEALIPNYNPGNPANAFTIQHDFGRNNNPFKVSLAFYDENLKEYKIRSDFEKAWERSKRSKTPLTDRKKAFNVFKEDLLKLNVQSAPSMVTRDRVFGEGLDLTKAIRAGKEAGAKIPKGMFKEASEFEKLMSAAKKTGTEGFIDLNLLRDIGKGAGTAFKALPTLAPTAALTAGFGVDPTSAIDRATLATEAAFAPGLVQQAAKFSPAVQRVLNLGLSPQLALRAARIASPVGIASLAAEGLYQAGKFSRDRIRELQAMTPEEREELRRQGEAFAFDAFQAAGGGLAKQAGDRSGAMLESMNPDKDGLPGLLKRVKKV